MESDPWIFTEKKLIMDRKIPNFRTGFENSRDVERLFLFYYFISSSLLMLGEENILFYHSLRRTMDCINQSNVIV